MKKHFMISIALLSIPIIVITFSLLSLGNKSPVTLTLWHNYGGQLKNIMDEMIDEFNATVGAKEGVLINVTSISGSSTLHNKLVMAGNDDPGAPSLPDITTAYPKTAMILADKNLLVDLEELFTNKELDEYIPRFIDEGRLSNGSLYVFPTAKSTEVLFVNKTIFDRFSEDTGLTLDDLKTFEGITKAAALYYIWTDAKTPETANDGKAFYVADSLFNYSLIGCKQLGIELIKNQNIDFSDKYVFQVWNCYFTSAISGHTAIYDGYSSDLAKTGDIVCSTGSTAGLMFYSPNVTYADNTKEIAELAILPYPTFEGGEKVAIQRGAGMCIVKSNKEKEKLAGMFLKWFTSPENNLKFISTTGYLPVTKEAYGDIMLKEINTINDDNIKKLLMVAREMQMEYEFYIPPLFDKMDEMQENYERTFHNLTKESRYIITDTNKYQTKNTFKNLTEEKYKFFSQMLEMK